MLYLVLSLKNNNSTESKNIFAAKNLATIEKIYTYCSVCIFFTNINAQTEVTGGAKISGKVVDSTSGLPLDYVLLHFL